MSHVVSIFKESDEVKSCKEISVIEKGKLRCVYVYVCVFLNPVGTKWDTIIKAHKYDSEREMKKINFWVKAIWTNYIIKKFIKCKQQE